MILDRETLDQFVQWAADSAGCSKWREAHASAATVNKWGEFEAALLAALGKWGQLTERRYFLESSTPTSALMATDKDVYLLFMSLNDSGRTILDGDWDGGLHLSEEGCPQLFDWLRGDKHLHHMVDLLESTFFVDDAFETGGLIKPFDQLSMDQWRGIRALAAAVRRRGEWTLMRDGDTIKNFFPENDEVPFPLRMAVSRLCDGTKDIVLYAAGSGGTGEMDTSAYESEWPTPPLLVRLDRDEERNGAVLVLCEDVEGARHDQTIHGCRWEFPDGEFAMALIEDYEGLAAALEAEGYEVEE